MRAPCPDLCTDSNVTVGLSSSGCVVLRGTVGVGSGGLMVLFFKSSGPLSAIEMEVLHITDLCKVCMHLVDHFLHWKWKYTHHRFVQGLHVVDNFLQIEMKTIHITDLSQVPQLNMISGNHHSSSFFQDPLFNDFSLILPIFAKTMTKSG